MKILFVDDEPNILSGLRRMLRAKRDEWQMEFREHGAEALKLMSETPYDVIVSDMRMPGMDGVQLLSEVKTLYPGVIRIALSGQTEAHMIYRCVEHAHQYLAKPCDMETLTQTINRAYALRSILEDKTLSNLVSNLSSLPSMPEQYRLIMDELQSQSPSVNKIGEIIESDVAMTAKILQLVNSAFFGLARHVSSPRQAAVYLGVEVLRSLVVSTGVFSQFDKKSHAALNIDSVWSKSMRIGALAKAIAQQSSDDKIIADYAYMAGMLADVGQIVLACNMPDEAIAAQNAALTGEQPHWECETEIIGHNHTQIGAYLVGLWGLPNAIVEAVAFHHHPALCPGAQFSALTAVHVASALVQADGASEMDELDLAYIESLGMSEQIDEWRGLIEVETSA